MTSYQYDDQGNTRQRPGPSDATQTLTWDIEGELTRLVEGGKTTDYLYDANGGLLIRRRPGTTVLYMDGQELRYDTAAKKFSGLRYYAAGDASAVRTQTSLSWMVDDRPGTASMAVDATTQQVTRRYPKPFGESRGQAAALLAGRQGIPGQAGRHRDRPDACRRP
ncbi:hypothetical protein [Streptomyces sp. R41]|uniref:YD repeat-containing protein n=1 Tax=Streptomyces sp. R41 TaxID=3238632 RepID=A0AB39RWS0_9ACTN